MKLLVLVAGGFHVGYAGCYGNDWTATPALDTLAAAGVVFDQHHADRPTAAGARRAWRTGRHDFPLPGMDRAMLPPCDLLALLRQEGVATALIIGPRQEAAPDFELGWDHIVPVSGSERDLDKIRRAAVKTLARLNRSDSWLLWIDLPALLPPWHVPEEYLEPYFADESEEQDVEGEEAEQVEPALPLTPLIDPTPGPVDPDDDTTFLRLQRTYAAAVTRLDEGIGTLIEAVEEHCPAEELTVVFTTDRGLPLGEHGVIGLVRPWLHDELAHLPLIVRLPGAAEAGRRVQALTQPVDVMPTLLKWFGVPIPELHGHSLVPLIHGEVEEVRPYACIGLAIGGAVEWALRTPEWGFILPVWLEPGDRPRSPQLYVKPEDRWEWNNVILHHSELAGRLEQTLRGFVEAARQPGPLRPPALPDLEAERAADGEAALKGAAP